MVEQFGIVVKVRIYFVPLAYVCNKRSISNTPKYIVNNFLTFTQSTHWIFWIITTTRYKQIFKSWNHLESVFGSWNQSSIVLWNIWKWDVTNFYSIMTFIFDSLKDRTLTHHTFSNLNIEHVYIFLKSSYGKFKITLQRILTQYGKSVMNLQNQKL